MANYVDNYYKDSNNNVYFLSAQDQQNIADGLCPTPIKSDWVVITYEEAMAIANPPYVPTQQDTINAICYAIQNALNLGAQAWGYDDMVTAATYATSTNEQYAADAAALIGWRDAVWAWAIPQFPDVVAGTDPKDFIANMPAQPAQPSVLKAKKK